MAAKHGQFNKGDSCETQKIRIYDTGDINGNGGNRDIDWSSNPCSYYGAYNRERDPAEGTIYGDKSGFGGV